MGNRIEEPQRSAKRCGHAQAFASDGDDVGLARRSRRNPLDNRKSIPRRKMGISNTQSDIVSRRAYEAVAGPLQPGVSPITFKPGHQEQSCNDGYFARSQ